MSLRYLVTRWLYRPLSLPAARVLARTSVTPVQVTWVSAALSLIAAVAFARAEYAAGAVLAFVGVIADCVDGDLARISGRTSRWGAFLDSVLDRWIDSALILGLWWSNPGALGEVAALALVGSLLTSYTRARAQSLGVDCPDGIGGRDSRLLVLVIGPFFGFVFASLALVAFLGWFTSVHRLVLAGRALRHLDREERVTT
ncbi:MAG TPA: CDP-alcohol phosphatidyltransferase family protein [Actinomycetota bacterium]|nr:CDP-alcohol phosphatidyltransferase family protein [Actinomycetota bacterium]